jgi:hypothetical protein
LGINLTGAFDIPVIFPAISVVDDIRKSFINSGLDSINGTIVKAG